MARAMEIQQPKQMEVSSLVTPTAMIQQAIASGAGIEVMEKLLAMNERYDAFQARKAFDDAMATLRQDMPTVLKKQSADFGNGGAAYKYEDLSAVTEVISPIMANVGLSFRWRTQSNEKGVAVTCIISHRDGHSEETTLAAGFDTSGKKNAIQSLGSAVTYLQRYTLKAAVGIAAAKDDDAQAAGEQAERPQQLPRPTVSIFDRAAADLRAAATIPALQAIWVKITEIPERDLSQALYDDLAAICNERQAALKAQSTKAPDPFGFDAMEGEIPFPGDLPPESAEAVRNLRG
jgi:hypothetical protein